MDNFLIPEEESHPAVVTALRFLDTLSVYKLQEWLRFFNNCSKENTLAKKCAATIRSLIKGESISEKDLLGLAWTLRFDLYQTIDYMEKNKE